MLGATDEASLSVEAYLDEWLAHVRSRVRPTTYEGYEALIRCHVVPHLAEVPLAALRPLDLQALYSELLSPDRERALSGGTVLNTHLVLTQALGQAVRWGLLAANPAAGAQPPRPQRPEQATVDPELAQRVLQAARGTPLELPVALAIATGMRRGEILALRWSDVDTDALQLRVRRSLQPTGAGLVFAEPKTRRSRRSVALPRFLLPYLDHQRADQLARAAFCGAGWAELDLVIDRGDGSPVNPDSMSSAWRGLVARSGLPHLRFHDLRHAHATLMLAKGVHPKVVSERLGHASIGITLDTYSHVLPSMQAEAADAVDELFSEAASAAPD
jgi:integrase